MQLTALCLGLFLLLLLGATHAESSREQQERGYDSHPEAQDFLERMVNEDGFSHSEVAAVLRQARRQKTTLEAMERPYRQPPPWYEYAGNLLTESRIEAGERFMTKHGEALQAAENKYQVPAEIITAVIGVETFYGKHMGNYRVLDALSTLAFDYPRRAEYFRAELRQFLLMTREIGSKPTEPRGSFAGAMGMAQFMPSSYRVYAVDSNEDGHADIWKNAREAIDSVANYLVSHGWQPGGELMLPVVLGNPEIALPPSTGLSEPQPLGYWLQNGVSITDGAQRDANSSLRLLKLDFEDGDHYWLAPENFSVILTYNKSRMYAAAVAQLAENLAERRGKVLAQPAGEP